MKHQTGRGARTSFKIVEKTRRVSLFVDRLSRVFAFRSKYQHHNQYNSSKKVAYSVPSRTRTLLASVLVLAPIIGALYFVFLPSGSAHAAPTTLNFQARLLTSGGSLVEDGDYHVEFKLYDSESAGASAQGTCAGGATDDCVWVETRTTGNLVRVANGYISVNLGDVTAFGSIDWSQQYWLTMNIGGTAGSPSWDGEMSPRIQLTSVPYAFQADTLDGRDSTGFVQLDPGASAQNVNSSNTAIHVNQQGGGDLLNLKAGGSSLLSLSNGGNLAVSGNGDFNGSLTVGSSNQFQINSSGNLTTSGTGAFQGSTLSIGSASTTTGALQLYNNTNGFSVSINAPNQTVGSATFSFPDTAGSNDTICLQTEANCSSGGGLFTDDGTFAYLTDTADDFVLGSSTVANAALYMDVSAGNLYVGTDGSQDGTLTLYSSGGGTAASISTNATGDLNLSSPSGSVNVGNGSGDINLDLTNEADVLTADKTATLTAAYASEDFSFDRILTSNNTAHSLGGAVLSVTDTSTVQAGTTINYDLIFGNAATTGDSFTGNLLRLQSGGSDAFTVNASGAISQAAGITSSGTITFSGLDCTSNANGGAITANASGVLSCTDDDSGTTSPFTTTSNVVHLNTSTDNLTVGSATNLAKLGVDGDADEVQLLVQGHSTQNSDLLVLEQSGGTDVLNVANNGDTTFAGNLTVAASKTITLTGDTTGNRPAGTDGELYFDTDTGTLLTYDADKSKWIANRGEYVIVASGHGTDPSTQAEQDAADYVTDGTSDQTEINSAISAASGGKVLLLSGTYTVSGTITLGSNTQLHGSGTSTIVQIASSHNATLAIITLGSGGTGDNIVVRDFVLDGNKSNNTSGTQSGIIVSDSDNVENADISYMTFRNFRNNGIQQTLVAGDGLDDSRITNSYFTGMDDDAITLGVSDYTVISNNTFESNDSGITIGGSSSNNIVNGNVFSNHTTVGVQVVSSSGYNQIINNKIDSTSGRAIYISASSWNVVSNNYADNGADSSAVIEVYANGSFGDSANNNTITNNHVVDSTGNEILIDDDPSFDGADSNYIAGNTGDGAVVDNANNTVQNGQVASSGDYLIQPAGSINLTADTNITGALDVTAATTLDGNLTIGNANTDTLTINAGSSGSGITFGDSSFQSCSALETDASGVLTCGTDDTGGGSGAWQTTTNVVNLTTSTDNVTIGSATNHAKLGVDGDTDEVQLLVQGHSTQTNDLFVLQQSDGTTDVLTVSNAGNTSIAGTLTVTGAGSFNGNLTIGNANTDTLTINAGSSGSGIVFGDSSFANCSALETVSGVLTCGTDNTGSGGGGNGQITFTPEYAGAVLSADGSNNNGTMTAGHVSGLTGTPDHHNYYEWTTSRNSVEDYDIILTTELPQDFSSFNASSMKIFTYANVLTDATITWSMFDASGTDCHSTDDDITATTANTWEQITITDPSGCTFSAGDIVKIQIKVAGSSSSNQVRVGEFHMYYTKS